MKERNQLYAIEGKGLPVPDANVTVKTTDVEGESARDRSGMLHRTVLRRVRAWEFSYRELCDEDRAYLMELLTPGVFYFTHPQGESLCCCKGFRMDMHDLPRAMWQNVRFVIEEV